MVNNPPSPESSPFSPSSPSSPPLPAAALSAPPSPAAARAPQAAITPHHLPAALPRVIIIKLKERRRQKPPLPPVPLLRHAILRLHQTNRKRLPGRSPRPQHRALYHQLRSLSLHNRSTLMPQRRHALNHLSHRDGRGRQWQAAIRDNVVETRP